MILGDKRSNLFCLSSNGKEISFSDVDTWTRRLGGAAAAGTPSVDLLTEGRTKGGDPPNPWVKIVTMKNRIKETKASLILEGLGSSTSGVMVIKLFTVAVYKFS